MKKAFKSFILQHDQSDCGVACLLSVVKFYSGSNTLENLRDLSGTDTQGTTLLGLYQAANKIGFNASGCEADVTTLINHKRPVILHVIIDGKLNHYVVFYGYKNQKFIIGDPAKGIVYYTKEELLEVWKERKCLTLKVNSNFKQVKEVSRAKKIFLINLFKDDYPLLGVSLLFGILISILGMVMAVYSQQLIDHIFPSKNSTILITSIVLVTFLLLVRIAFEALRQQILLRQSKDFNNRIIHSFYKTLLYLSKSFFDSRKIGELVARLNDTGRIQRVVNQLVGNVLIDGLVLISSLVFLFVYSWQSGFIALLSLPIYFYLLYRFNKNIISAQQDVMSAYAYSEGNYINTLQGVNVIKNFNKQELFSKLNKYIYGFYQDKIVKLGKINIKLSFISSFASVLFLSSILLFTSLQVYTKDITIGDLMAILGIASSLLPSIASIALVAIPINEAKIAFDRMYEFVSIKHEKTLLDCVSSSFHFKSLQVNSISFRFPGRKHILSNISVDVKRNEIIALVGESGSGKSTLGQILQLFYTPESGSVTLNNDLILLDIHVNMWRNILGVVPQDTHLFNGTVLDNISLNNTHTESESIKAFCQEYGFHLFIEQLPQSYFTIIGEEGVNLSGGQKQIIALARALYHKPQVLLLDEATSALDRKTERFVLDLLLKLKKDLGIIFISHRIYSLKNICDRIYVLENGEISAKGTHNELMNSDNMYSDYWSFR